MTKPAEIGVALLLARKLGASRPCGSTPWMVLYVPTSRTDESPLHAPLRISVQPSPVAANSVSQVVLTAYSVVLTGYSPCGG
jgi:hypothetical protein